MNVAIEKEIIIHLTKIEDQITHLNSKIENFFGFEDMTLKEIEEIDKIEEDMEKGNKISLNDII